MTSVYVATPTISRDENHLKDILSRFLQGSSKDFDIFVSRLANPATCDTVLVRDLRGLKTCITLLGKDFELLVGVILKLEWASKDLKVVREYESFILNLVSAHTMYLRACLHMIVRSFMPSVSKEDPITDKLRDKHEQCFLHLHRLLSSLLRLVPLAPAVLLPLLGECFPFMSRTSYVHECYVRNLLQLSTYLQAERSKILEIIVDRMTRLDVRSSRESIQEAEDNEVDNTDDIFTMDEVVQELNSVDSMPHADANKLDILMKLMFTYIHNICHVNGELDWEATKKLYRELLTAFDRIILPTHASCHVQYLIFYIISFKEPLVEGFLDYLWKKVQNPNTAPIFRQAAVAYTASLLARAKFIHISVVKAVVDLLVSWVRCYAAQSCTDSKPDITHHGPFYSVCQAIFYVFAFKHKDLMAMPEGDRFCESLKLQTIVTCRLNPLRICLPIVANTFCSVTRIHQLAFCDTILEKNRRSALPVAGTYSRGMGTLTNLNPLDSFFPFDPYLLRHSGAYIGALYQEYDGAVIQETNMHPQEEEMYGEQTNEDTMADILMTANSPSHLLLYGTSPGYNIS